MLDNAEPIEKFKRHQKSLPATYFLRIPVSVVPRLLTALLAAGVSTAADGAELEFVRFRPRLFPVVPWLSALKVFGPGDPPVPLIVVLPFDSELPAARALPVALVPLELPPALLPELCASAKEPVKASEAARMTVLLSMVVYPVGKIDKLPWLTSVPQFGGDKCGRPIALLPNATSGAAALACRRTSHR